VSIGITYRPRAGLCTAPHGSALVILDLDRETYFSLDEVGTRVWQLLALGMSVDRIAGQVACEYHVPVERAGADVGELVATLLNLKLITSR